MQINQNNLVEILFYTKKKLSLVPEDFMMTRVMADCLDQADAFLRDCINIISDIKNIAPNYDLERRVQNMYCEIEDVLSTIHKLFQVSELTDKLHLFTTIFKKLADFSSSFRTYRSELETASALSRVDAELANRLRFL